MNPSLDSIALLRALAPREGYNLTALPDVRVLRSDRSLTLTPVLYDPGIVFVCQGAKRGYFGDAVFVYDEQHYLAVSVPVPFTMQSEGSAERPLLALYLHLDVPLAAGLMLEIEHAGGVPPAQAPKSLMSSPMDDTLRQTVQRLLQALSQPLDAAILGRALVRELYFRVLTGPQGQTLRAALAQQGRFGRIGRALQRIHRDHARRLDVAQLAQEAGMSAPSFHVHFKAVTQVAPMQYLKSIRLHQARVLMARDGMTATAACHAVGYESASQFNREFKRLFGRSPRAEVARMRADFAVPPAAPGGGFVASH
ncbi:AraC family transcriptional regulator [Luteimonas sp. S4-F44]|uniref:AraC family transcriptional regulator n=1 Tax=Luteimonas sp. S4-F44 TaxID=2925842 RepID=UPI001F52E71E|nr:AraC family transcriptional regulator [Luteimonas sp. S4-F44]UNK43689.1 AraC family transcriptional regulator [Luteimonas sp. S4-F44]